MGFAAGADSSFEIGGDEIGNPRGYPPGSGYHFEGASVSLSEKVEYPI